MLSSEIEVIKKELEKARHKQRLLRKKIDELRSILRAAGVNPDAPKIDLVPRNRKIFREWKKGKSFKELAAVFGLSTATIGSVCRRIEMVLETRRPGYRRYKGLMKYLR